MAQRIRTGSSVSEGDELYRADLSRRGISMSQANIAGLSFTLNARDIFPEFPRTPAILIPYFSPSGEPATFSRAGEEVSFGRIRCLGEQAPSFARTKPSRYLQPRGSSNRLYFPQVKGVFWDRIGRDPSRTILITEGEFKSLVATSAGFNCLGLGGVSNFLTKAGDLISDFDAIEFKNRRVVIVYDSDLTQNLQVQLAERRLAAELLKLGARVHLARLPQSRDAGKVGIDDFLLAKGADALQEILHNAEAAEPTASLVVHGTDVEIADAVLTSIGHKRAHPPVFCEGSFHAFDGEAWRRIEDAELRNAVCQFDCRKAGLSGRIKITKSRIESVLSIMAARAAEPDFFSHAPIGINCKDGFVQFDETGTPFLEAHAPEHRQRGSLSARWNGSGGKAEGVMLQKLLHGCFQGDEDHRSKVDLIGEALGVAALGLATQMTAPQAVVFYGPGANNGKSQVLELFTGLLPKSLVSSIPPSSFAKADMLVNLAGRHLNACAELGTGEVIAGDRFKSVVTGDLIDARQLYQSAVFFKPIALHILATNVLPPFRGGFDRGVQRRLLPLLFNRSIPASEQVPAIGHRIVTEEADMLLAFAVEGASRVIREGRFTCPPSSREALRQWVHGADPVAGWLADRTTFDPDNRLPVKAAYSDFVAWADGEGFRTDRLPSGPNFANRLYSQDHRISPVRSSGERFISGIRLQERARGAWRGNIVAIQPRSAER